MLGAQRPTLERVDSLGVIVVIGALLRGRTLELTSR